MIYFVLWVIFLLIVLLAVPVAALLENRKFRVPKSKRPNDADEPTDKAEPLAAKAQTQEEAEFSAVDGGEDFPAFDDLN